MVVEVGRAAADEWERGRVAVEVARNYERQLPISVVAESQESPDDGLLAVLLCEGRCEHRVSDGGGKLVPPLTAELQPAV